VQATKPFSCKVIDRNIYLIYGRIFNHSITSTNEMTGHAIHVHWSGKFLILCALTIGYMYVVLPSALSVDAVLLGFDALWIHR
jgi:hypothetical protein